MRTSRDGGPAFPRTEEGPGGETWSYHGMSMRDYFAGQALTGFLAHGVGARLAAAAYEQADAMLVERERRLIEEQRDESATAHS